MVLRRIMTEIIMLIASSTSIMALGRGMMNASTIATIIAGKDKSLALKAFCFPLPYYAKT